MYIKKLNLVLGIVLGIGYFLCILHSILLQKEAREMLFYPRQLFVQDYISIKKSYLGFIDIVNLYPKTKSGNIATFYAGVCSYKLRKYKKAIKFFKAFSSKDEILSAIKYGILADSFLELKKNERAIQYYIKAVYKINNKFTTPFYIRQVAILYLSINKYKESKRNFYRIINKYPTSPFAKDIDTYLSMINQILQIYETRRVF
ncbi:MAG TPA: tetratricopeptide repeat protein [Candidatus Angelobacter sp.]|jgi:tetratricopeptide (TPR) repeat protein|nr:tetratricopeptide repeat protein [Candidatus Angelobacter sp.]